MINFALRYLELIFTLAGLLVIVGVTGFLHPAGISVWTVAAITATSVGVVHGLLFWIVRQRQRQVRREILRETQHMLRDVILNQLTVVRIGADLQSSPSAAKAALTQMEIAFEAIDLALSDISEESLARWRSRYKRSTPPC